jgi:hypothetical protein
MAIVDYQKQRDSNGAMAQFNHRELGVLGNGWGAA